MNCGSKFKDDRLSAEKYCRNRWPMQFEDSDFNKEKFDKIFNRRVMFETRAANYFKGGSELDMLDSLVRGADAKTGLLPIEESQKVIFECFKEGTAPTEYTPRPGYEVITKDNFFKDEI